ncbi:hypothetical protein [Carboxylicivirga sp. M1479]|uniref:hypothetical protein n=1 Tax=Carboxylicivirga sp. M1479 TaxID=2594476 RepID=UPI0011776620|nr:hypothetical protein [Carboxylicivirga sp. M1479]TRX70927.1 hypothetical protein FNN09_08860 [Carboxylicivirga sp. M1479]
MKINILSFLFLIITCSLYGQDRILTFASKDSVGAEPVFKGSFGANIKLNGYFDVYGGLQDSETFNIGKINVFGDDDSKSLNVDMYQTQLKFESALRTKEGKNIYALVEFDFWGGNGHMRLRKAYVEFDHWQIGQGWASFGDEALWPNIMEWEGPPSGIWVRTPHIKYFNSFGNPNWRYIIALDAPIADVIRNSDLEPLLEEDYQTTPDVILGMKHEKQWGHIRLSSIFRNIRYRYNDESDAFLGYGLSFSGMLKKKRNNLQFQGIWGKGIASYITSIGGFGYDGFPTNTGTFEPTPTYGGWMAYEHYWTRKIHTNMVLGYSRFYTNDTERYLLSGVEEDPITVIGGDINHRHGYGIINIMFDHYERMTYGIELNYGIKSLQGDGYVDEDPFKEDKSRDAMRISFGFMFYF